MFESGSHAIQLARGEPEFRSDLAPGGTVCLASRRRRESPCPSRARLFRLGRLRPPRQPNALREALLLEREPHVVMARIGYIGNPVDHSQRKQNGGIISEG